MSTAPEPKKPDPATLEAWCQAAAAGDRSALERLLMAHHGRLLGFARRKIGVDWQGRIEPEDILQEAYVDVFATISAFQYRDEESFYHWVTRIVDHRFIDQVRHWRRKKRDTQRQAAAGPHSAAHVALLERCQAELDSPSTTLRMQDAIAALLLCMAKLPPDYRTVVQRWYLDQDPLAGIAADMQRTEDAVRRLAGRAIEALCRCMGDASRYMSTDG